MDFIERVKSKNWKERQEAYFELGNFFKEGKYLEILPLLQNEVNIPALEVAIDAILKAPIISTTQVSKIFLQIGNPKVKNKIVSLINNIKDSDLPLTLIELIKNKNPKVVSSIIPTLPPSMLILEEGVLDIVLNHPDKNVRSEGIELAKSIYKKVGTKIKPYLSNIKPIIVKELDIKEEVIINIDNINDPKWSVRLETLTQILNNNTYNYNIDLLVNRINDPNNQVFFLVLDIIKKFLISSTKINNLLIERLKDKKSSITDKIKDTLVSIKVNQVPPSFFLSKSPELKSNLIEVVIKNKIVEDEVIKGIEKCVEDGNQVVRSKALEALSVLEYDKSLISSKTHSKLNSIKNVDSTNKNVDSTNSKNVDSTNSKNLVSKNLVSKNSVSKNLVSKKSDSSLLRKRIQVSVNKGVLESFHYKYPFLAEKTWSIRLEGIRNNLSLLKKEDITDLSSFIYSSRDPNFQVNIQYIDLLLSRKKEIEVEEILIYFCIEKCTEVKMRTKILELLSICTTDLVVEILVEEAEKIKKGKKFVEIVKILENYSQSEGIEDIFKIPVTGLQEKKGVEELRRVRETSKESNVVISNSNVSHKSNSNVSNNNIEISINNIEISNNNIEYEDESTIVENYSIVNNESNNNSCGVLNNNSCSVLNNKDLSTNKDLSHIEKDLSNIINNTVVDSFPSLENTPPLEIISSFILKDVQSTFFNSLMIHFISRKYILTEEECLLLTRHFLSRGYYEEMSMIDRVYPVTKLFLILKKNLEKGEDCIIKILGKYINIEDKKEIKKMVLESKDFLTLIDTLNHKNSDTKDGKDEKVEFNTSTLTVDKRKPKQYSYKYNSDCLYKYNDVIAPSVYEEVDLDIDIETSLDCLNLSGRLTPNVKKFRKEFDSPMKNIENLEDILDNIIDSDQGKSEEAFRRLSEIIKKNINTVLFSANSIISSISIQLLDVLHRPLYAKLILNVLLRLSQSKVFCEQIRRETLESCNIDLINILKNEELSDTVSDILTNLCINSKMSVILEVYLNILHMGDIPLKLIWRHSKSLDMKNKEEVQKVFNILEEFYKRSVYTELLENITTFKIVVLHLREICVYYQEKVKTFNMGRYTKKIVTEIMSDGEINVTVVRR